MRRAIALLAAAGLALSLAAGSANAQKIDKNGRCHDAAGRYAKAEVCQGAGAATGGASTSRRSRASSAKAAAAPAPAPPTAGASTSPVAKTSSSGGRCRDAATKRYVKCGTPNSVPAGK